MIEWLQGTGYVRLWERLHRAEEAWIIEAPIEQVIAGGEADELRLQGSTIDNRDQLIALVKSAVVVLKQYAGIGAPAAVAVAGVPVTPAAMLSPADERLARETLRQVRQAINSFRDECRLGLVRARNQLLRTVATTSFVAYLLLALAIGVNAPRDAIIGGTTFVLVGAVIGLFNRLYLDATAQTAIEDYGLSTARLLHTPIFSGLAAIGGVVIIPLLTTVINPGDAASSVPAVLDILDVNKRPFGLVIAAIFGLSPATLINRLQEESEQYKTGLKSSEAPRRE